MINIIINSAITIIWYSIAISLIVSGIIALAACLYGAIKFTKEIIFRR